MTGASQADTVRYVAPKAIQQNNGSQFVEYAAQCAVPFGQLAHGTTGANMWFTVPEGCKKGQPGEVASVGIATGAVSEYPLPKYSKPIAIAENAGYVWVADTYKNKSGQRLMYRFNENGTSQTFPIPDAIDVTSMTAGHDGNLWFVGSYVQAKPKKTLAAVGYMAPNGTNVAYAVGGTATPDLVSIAAGSDGNLWIADESGAIDKVVPATGAITTYAVGGRPYAIVNSSNVLVYSDAIADQLSIITTSGVAKNYPAPSGEHPAFIASKTDGSVLYVDSADKSKAIGTFLPSTHAYDGEVQAPNGGLLYLLNAPDGNMWFTDAVGHVGAYLKFVLTTNPTTFYVGPPACSQSFTATESNYNGTLTATSRNTAVATVSPSSGPPGATFTISEVAPGTTVIAVQDSMQNIVEIPLNVTGSCGHDSYTYGYTGAQQNFTVPTGVTQLLVDAYGATAEGSDGGFVEATIPVTPGETLALFVGGTGELGGFNGGGAGGYGLYNRHYFYGGNGGGATDLRQGGNGLGNRVIVAGGAGGNSDFYAGGAGGGLIGATGSGETIRSSGYTGGGGGSQSAGGPGGEGVPGCGEGAPGSNGSNAVGGAGGDGDIDPSGGCGGDFYGGGGGGGGYYGGGGGGGDGTDGGSGGGGGGGGSSYAEAAATGVTSTQGVSTAPQITVSWGGAARAWLRKSVAKAGAASPASVHSSRAADRRN